MTKVHVSTAAAFTLVASLASLGAACNKSADSDDAGASTAAAAAADTSDPPDQTATTPPPAPQAENPGPAPTPNDTWAAGSWKFESGRYVWEKGHWEPRREGAVYVQPRWIQVNGRWEHHPGRWVTTARPPEPHPMVPARPVEHPVEPHPAEPPRPLEHR